MSTAFIIDPPLRNSAGHHRALASGWGAAAHENGYDVQILAHEDWPSDSLDGFEAKRVFSGEYYSVASDRDLPLATQLRLRQTAFRDTLAKPLRGISRDDVLVLTYPTAYTMNGVAAWAAGLPEERRPSLLVWLLYGPTDDEFSTAMNSTDIAIAAYDRLRRLFGDRVTFLASTQVIAAECRRLGAGDFFGPSVCRIARPNVAASHWRGCVGATARRRGRHPAAEGLGLHRRDRWGHRAAGPRGSLACGGLRTLCPDNRLRRAGKAGQARWRSVCARTAARRSGGL